MLNHIRGAHGSATFGGVLFEGTVTLDARPLDPRPSLKLRNHSPTGFNWGYAGSGPAQLALAILLAAGVPTRDALDSYQAFKFAILANVDHHAPLMIDVDVCAWVTNWIGEQARSRS